MDMYSVWAAGVCGASDAVAASRRFCKPERRLGFRSPQFSASFCGLTHTPAHSIWPFGHSSRHAPLLHTSPDLHALPHAPQFAGSDPSAASHPVSARPSQSRTRAASP